MNRRRSSARLSLGVLAATAIALPCVLVAGGSSAAGVAPVTCNGKVATILGTDGDDELEGTMGPDVVWLGAGNDTFVDPAQSGEASPERTDDLICGGAGDDTIDAGSGQDEVHGDHPPGAEDVPATEGGDDELLGGLGEDRLFGGPGDDVLHGGAETVRVVYRRNELYGGPGADILHASDAGDHLMDDRSHVYAYDESRSDRDDGADQLIGGAGDDQLTLSSVGTDGVARADVVTGGGGNDTVNYRLALAGVVMAAGPGTATHASGVVDRWSGIEALVGSALADTLIGTDGDDDLDGVAGQDVIVGRGGDDTLAGGGGTISGNTGNDRYAAANDVGFDVRVSLGKGDDTATVASGTARVRLGSGNDKLRLLGPDPYFLVEGVLAGGAGADTLTMRDADRSMALDVRAGTLRWRSRPTAYYDPIRIGGFERYIGSSRTDRMAGGPEAEVIKGREGNDVIRGRGGNDKLRGGSGRDVVDGGSGRDSCTGERRISC